MTLISQSCLRLPEGGGSNEAAIPARWAIPLSACMSASAAKLTLYLSLMLKKLGSRCAASLVSSTFALSFPSAARFLLISWFSQSLWVLLMNSFTSWAEVLAPSEFSVATHFLRTISAAGVAIPIPFTTAYAGSLFVMLLDKGHFLFLITRTALCPRVFLRSKLAGQDSSFIWSLAAFVRVAASSVVSVLATRLSIIFLPLPRVAKLHLSAKSPFLKGNPAPTASMTPLPVLYLKGS